MPLSANSRLGPYEIKSTLGVGGMGEVYRARDSRLNRDVAIKVLREDGASADLRSRFEREARAVAALNHPNIVAVYDFGIEPSETGAQQYIVSELIEGESLRSLLRGKPVPVRKLIEIAAQVADGHAAAHAAGVIHRDLKPENILLTKDGRAKILDFGLARQSRAAGSSRKATGEEETVAPAIDETKHLTSEGAVLGTASYMSPEQALGKEVDYRSDQFSFGLILHEMASGKQAFARNSSVETMAAIVRDEPAVIEEKIPAPLKWIIDRCLHKEPEQRYESTRDLFHELKNLREHFSEASTSGALAPVAAAQAKSRSWKIPAICAACLLLAAFLGYLLRPAGQDIGKYRYTPIAVDAYTAVWAPDGKAVAYSGQVDGTYQAFLRYLDSPIPVQLTHEKYPVSVLGWSSDRNHLIVYEDTDWKQSPPKKLYSVPIVGGQLDFIMDADCDACDLSRDGKVFATLARAKNPGDLVHVYISDPLGSPLRPYAPNLFASKDIGNAPDLTFSPDGTKLLASRAGEQREKEVWLLPYPAGDKPLRRILKSWPGLGISPGYFSWLPDSRHVVVNLVTANDTLDQFWMADTESNDLTPLTASNTTQYYPAVAPDGASFIYNQLSASTDVLSVSLEDGSVRTMVSTGRMEERPAWSERTEKLAWLTNRSGPWEIWVRGSDRAERPAVTPADFPEGRTLNLNAPALSPDGERLIFTRNSNDGASRLWLKSLAGGSPVRLTNVEPSIEVWASWSPDSSRCVYLQVSPSRISLMEIRTSGGATPIELKKDVQGYPPNWSPTGDWITYRDEKGWNLISPDGKTTKSLGRIESQHLAFSKDGKLVYGIEASETGGDPKRGMLFSLDPATLKKKEIKDIGKDLGLPTPFPDLIFSLAPDGKSIACTGLRARYDLWMLTGYRQPGLWNQIKETLHLNKPN